jgi:DNA-binding LacI/PurR family transcriptional regulator
MMSVTIVDIAKMAGVSQTTVSRVLNDPARVREATRERVLQIMAENDYVYNALAGGIGKKNTHTLGLIIPTIGNPIFALSTNGCAAAAALKRYSILLGNTEYSTAREFELIRLFLEKQVDGIVLTGSPLHDQSIGYLRKKNVPFVITWEKTDDHDISYVTFDNARAAGKAVAHLINLGHRRIAFISGSFLASGRAKRRYDGYRKELERAKLHCDEQLVIQTEFTVAAGRKAVHKLLQLSEPPTAILCATDILAYGAMVGAKDRQKKIGVDLSIIGFDNLEMSSAMDPPLTSVQIPALEMGEIAAGILIDIIEGKSTKAVQKMLKTDLIVRQSVADLNK